MEKLRKIAIINGYPNSDTIKVVEALEKQGFIVVDDDEKEVHWKTWHVMEKV
ncbi:hypothetical protein [Clostridium sp. AF32-12BH]|uniref:hypothetical protein n=1 Tax=Clostridium sp. AF32-12BH TaxID=2292006 RepID=UPI0015F99020|nr:hypothetical protein [Clostridium sp. AF32-12BH]